MHGVGGLGGLVPGLGGMGIDPLSNDHSEPAPFDLNEVREGEERGGWGMEL